MERNLDLIRDILFKIEKEFDGTAIYNLEINGFDKKTIANHCKLL